MTGRQIANLQGLRGIAAFLIVLYHVQPPLDRAYGLSLHSDFAVFGVDIFFVLSGFVMFYSNPAPRPSAVPHFLLQRLFRIVPLYWLATLAIIAFFLAGFRPVGLHELSPTIVAQSLIFIPSSFAGGRHDLILTVGWTLMFELFFYLSFALTFPMRSLEKSFAALAIAFTTLSLVGQILRPKAYLLDFYTSPIMLEFLYGAGAAIFYLRPWRGSSQSLQRGGLALLMLGLSLLMAESAAGVGVPNKHDLRFLLLGLPAFLVFLGALAMERGGWVLKSRFFLKLGAASYVLYTFHLLILQMSIKLLSWASPAIAGSFAIGACTIAAFAVHRRIEKPIIIWSKSLIASRSRIAVSAGSPVAMQAAE